MEDAKKYRIIWYRKDGTSFGAENYASGTEEWATVMKEVNEKLRDRDYRSLGWDKLWWGGFVSTIWLGLDHDFGSRMLVDMEDLELPKSYKPVIFETMVFDQYGRSGEMWRYRSEKKAIKSHKRIFRKYNGWSFGIKCYIRGLQEVIYLWYYWNVKRRFGIFVEKYFKK